MNRRIFATGSCPDCGSGKINVVRTERPRRRVKCRVCGSRWWTLELVEDFQPGWLEEFLETLLAEGRLVELLRDPVRYHALLSILGRR
jgi:hypothetical protein